MGHTYAIALWFLLGPPIVGAAEAADCPPQCECGTAIGHKFGVDKSKLERTGPEVRIMNRVDESFDFVAARGYKVEAEIAWLQVLAYGQCGGLGVIFLLLAAVAARLK